MNVIPNSKDPPLGPDGRFTLGWYRFLQSAGGGTGTAGPPGPAGPTGPSGPTGPPGPDNGEALAVLSLSTLDGSGGVTSVALAVPAEFTVSGSPIVGAGTLTISKANEGANQVWAGPASGGAAPPTFRALVSADLGGMSSITNSLSGNVSLSNTGTFFDGPSVAQGTSGTWLATGTVTLNDTAGGAAFNAKLWDGTTVIASARADTTASNQRIAIALSGFLANPAANIRISVEDATSTSGLILAAGGSGNTASTLTAIRIG